MNVGAIITHAVLSDDGQHLASAESGDLLFWSLQEKKYKSVIKKHEK